MAQAHFSFRYYCLRLANLLLCHALPCYRGHSDTFLWSDLSFLSLILHLCDYEWHTHIYSIWILALLVRSSCFSLTQSRIFALSSFTVCECVFEDRRFYFHLANLFFVLFNSKSFSLLLVDWCCYCFLCWGTDAIAGVVIVVILFNALKWNSSSTREHVWLIPSKLSRCVAVIVALFNSNFHLTLFKRTNGLTFALSFSFFLCFSLSFRLSHTFQSFTPSKNTLQTFSIQLMHQR